MQIDHSGAGVAGRAGLSDSGSAAGTPPALELIDTHCHLAFAAFDADREQVVARAVQRGVKACVVVAVDAATARTARTLARSLPGWAYATAGIHPTEPRVTSAAEWQAIDALLDEGGFVAVGETGLDAHHDCAPLPEQLRALHRHIETSLDRSLPVVLHCREAFAPMAEALAAYRGSPLRGVLHCFTGTTADLPALLEAGLHIGVGGATTYKANAALREAVRATPLERLVLETDAPWLSPVPVRGRRNEPAFVSHVATLLAADRGVDPASFSARTTANARALFDLDSACSAATPSPDGA